MSDNVASVKALTNKLETRRLGDDDLRPSETRLLLSWVNSNPSDELTADLLSALQRYGVNTSERADLFTAPIATCYTKTDNVEVAYVCLYNLSDSLYYKESIEPNVIGWVLEESRGFDKDSRAYKLAKSDFLTKVLAQKSCRKQWAGVYKWIRYVIESYGDDEYIDLLAFALTTNEVSTPRDVSECFRNYLEDHPSTEAKEEIIRLLASI